MNVSSSVIVMTSKKAKLVASLVQVVANPNVDAVLVLACFLAVVVFRTVDLLSCSSLQYL